MQVQPTAVPSRWRGAASFHCALATRWIAHRAAAELAFGDTENE
jgi:hypothetical protein